MASKEKRGSGEASGERAGGQGAHLAPDKPRRRSKKAAARQARQAAEKALRWRSAALGAGLSLAALGLGVLLWPSPAPHAHPPPYLPPMHCPPLPVAPDPLPPLPEGDAELMQGLRDHLSVEAREVPAAIERAEEQLTHPALAEELAALWLHAHLCVGWTYFRGEVEARAETFFTTYPTSRWTPVLRRELEERPLPDP